MAVSCLTVAVGLRLDKAEEVDEWTKEEEERFEGFTTVTMKNAVFCYIKTQFVHYRRYISKI
jgi:hypothetical protein